ncbi:hypothetical protein Slala05_45280 [Streptomyces lavendulae subsp. lavendulae]|nr:hypothetical protein Slala05_45280 [Streptomyces lavendulae subsp. lavendulae]
MTTSRFAGRYRTAADLSAPANPDPMVTDDGFVRVAVGAGLGPSDVATAVAFAQSIRNARNIEIIGTTRLAAEAARTLFLAAWDLPPVRDPSTPLEASTTVNWVGLMLAMAGYREDDDQR